MGLIAYLSNAVKKRVYGYNYSEETYINHLREKKIILGSNIKIWSPRTTYIDDTKPYLISIGDYVKITKGVTILAHDYSHSVLRRQFGEFRGGTKPVSIGSNVFIGMNSTILMGTTIGDNCIIGANSVVRGVFPSNSVIAGNPAKVIFSTDEMWQKVSDKWLNDAVDTARAIYKNKNFVLPTIEEMSDAYVWLYLPRSYENIEKYRKFFDLTCDDFEDIKMKFMESTPRFENFEAFLKYCDLEQEGE